MTHTNEVILEIAMLETWYSAHLMAKDMGKIVLVYFVPIPYILHICYLGWIFFKTEPFDRVPSKI